MEVNKQKKEEREGIGRAPCRHTEEEVKIQEEIIMVIIKGERKRRINKKEGN